MAEKCVGVIQDVTAGGVLTQKEEGVRRGSALSTFSSIMVTDRLMDEVRRESPWAMICIDGAVICGMRRKQMEENVGREICPGKQREQHFKCVLYK